MGRALQALGTYAKALELGKILTQRKLGVLSLLIVQESGHDLDVALAGSDEPSKQVSECKGSVMRQSLRTTRYIHWRSNSFRSGPNAVFFMSFKKNRVDTA